MTQTKDVKNLSVGKGRYTDRLSGTGKRKNQRAMKKAGSKNRGKQTERTLGRTLDHLLLGKKMNWHREKAVQTPNRLGEDTRAGSEDLEVEKKTVRTQNLKKEMQNTDEKRKPEQAEGA